TLGHVEETRSATVRLDTQVPVTTDDAPPGWQTGPVTWTLTPADAGSSGLAATESKLDAAASWSAGTSVAISRDGVHTIRYRSRDGAGNVEADKTATVRIDTGPPVTTDDAPPWPNNAPVTVTLRAAYAGAGVATTEIRGVG